MIPYGRQSVSQDDIDAVVSVLKSDFLTQGPMVPKFESAIAAYCNVPHAVAVNSATSALHIACLAIGVGPGDLVWTSPNTFVASANCARYCGASVDFVDIDPVTYNLCTQKLAEKLVVAEKTGALPKVVIPVHFAGQPCDMAAIHSLASRYGFRVIEDASHAIGSRYRESTTGACQYSDITVFSFHPVKIITTAEGGMATTKCATLARTMQLLRSHGITRDFNELENKSEGAWYYEQQMLGFNYRMTDIQAALGLSQLKNLEEWVARRHLIADNYAKMLVDLPVKLPQRERESRSALHLFPLQVENRASVFKAMRDAGIAVNVHYIPVHIQPDFRKVRIPGDLNVSEAYYTRAMSLPMYATLTEQQLRQTVVALRNALGK